MKQIFVFERQGKNPEKNADEENDTTTAVQIIPAVLEILEQFALNSALDIAYTNLNDLLDTHRSNPKD